jgi:hypothetical protein
MMVRYSPILHLLNCFYAVVCHITSHAEIQATYSYRFYIAGAMCMCFAVISTSSSDLASM